MVNTKATLPFASKQKDLAPRKQPLLKNPHERKVHTLVQHLQLLNIEKAAQPFASEPKDLAPRLENRRAVVMESPGRKLYTLVQQLQLIQAEKIRKRKLKGLEERKVVEVEKSKEEQEPTIMTVDGVSCSMSFLSI